MVFDGCFTADFIGADLQEVSGGGSFALESLFGSNSST